MTLKRIGFTAFIAIVSALVTVTGLSYFNNHSGQQTFEQKQAAKFTPVSYSTNNEVPAGLDFRYAAKMTTPGVVHIKTSYAAKNVSRNNNDPFRDFFGDNFNPFRDMQPYQQQPSEASG